MKTIRKLFFQLILLIFSCASIYGQNEPIHVTFFGSSVCRGAGALGDHGYSWQFFNNGAIDTLKYKYFNASTGGDNTIKVEKEQRIKNKLLPTNPDIVIIGLSLGNEGISSAKDDNGREQILEQFRSRLLTMADSLNQINIEPVIVNCYANSRFNESQYQATKAMNSIINTWDYPSINVLGAIDNLEGKWAEGYENDPLHPNTAGHEEMSYTIVPSLFDAILLGKKTPKYDWNRSYTTLLNENKTEQPVFTDIEHTMHSFTMSFRIKKAEEGSVAGFVSNNQTHLINIANDSLYYKKLAVSYLKNQNNWTHVLISHSYANQKTMFFINGELIGSIKEQFSPERIFFGGTSALTELKDITLHRSSLNASEALDLFNKKFIQSSLEFYNSLTKPIEENNLKNYAQSTSVFEINNQVLLKHQKVLF